MLRSIGPGVTAAAVLVGWFLWPFSSIAADPVGSVAAVLRAVALFIVVLFMTNIVASRLRWGNRLIVRCAIGFLFCLILGIAISIGMQFGFEAVTGEASEHNYLAPSVADAFWCGVALAIYYFLAGPRWGTKSQAGV